MISKSEGTTETEVLLAELCEQSFLKLWSYPNPYKEDSDELCDLLVVFGNHAFIFFDREKQLSFIENKSSDVVWKRWVRKVIDAQIRTAIGAEKYLRSKRSIYLDSKKETPFPIRINRDELIVHKIIVAHGAKDGCKAASTKNVSGSLAISYGNQLSNLQMPYLIELDNSDPIHVFDSENLPIILRQLDTIFDFLSYIEEKERVIKNHQNLLYCGEEDLLADFLLNYDSNRNCHFIGVLDEEVDLLFISEGRWLEFIESDTYKKTNHANEVSYLWDELIQITSQNALDGTLLGNAKLFEGKSAIFEMAKEPRFWRRELSENIVKVIKKFPEPRGDEIMRHVSFMPSFYSGKAYVFLQLYAPHFRLEKSYREKRIHILEIACGAAKNKFPELQKIIGIGMDAPKFSDENEEDFILMECSNWRAEDINYYYKKNEDFNFFNTSGSIEIERDIAEFK